MDRLRRNLNRSNLWLCRYTWDCLKWTVDPLWDRGSRRWLALKLNAMLEPESLRCLLATKLQRLGRCIWTKVCGNPTTFWPNLHLLRFATPFVAISTNRACELASW